MKQRKKDIKLAKELFNPKIIYDNDADIIFIGFRGKGKYERMCDHTIEVTEDFRLDVDKKGNILGVEIENFEGKIKPKKKSKRGYEISLGSEVPEHYVAYSEWDEQTMQDQDEFDKYKTMMGSRLEKGYKKYGDLMSECSTNRVMNEVVEELVDVSNHAYLLWLRQLKLMRGKKIK